MCLLKCFPIYYLSHNFISLLSNLHLLFWTVSRNASCLSDLISAIWLVGTDNKLQTKHIIHQLLHQDKWFHQSLVSWDQDITWPRILSTHLELLLSCSILNRFLDFSPYNAVSIIYILTCVQVLILSYLDYFMSLLTYLLTSSLFLLQCIFKICKIDFSMVYLLLFGISSSLQQLIHYI